MQTALAGVTEPGALLGVAVHLTDRGIDVDHQRVIAGPGARCPRRGQRLLGEPVELADMAEGERPKEGPYRRRRRDPMPQYRCGRPGAQHVYVIDAVRPSDHRL